MLDGWNIYFWRLTYKVNEGKLRKSLLYPRGKINFLGKIFIEQMKMQEWIKLGMLKLKISFYMKDILLFIILFIFDK